MTIVADQPEADVVAPAVTASTGRPRRCRPGRLTKLVPPLLGTAAFVGLWEWTGRAGSFGTSWIPLTEIWDEVGTPGRSEQIETAAEATFGRAFTGLWVGFAAALVLASLAALVPRVRNAVNGASVAINSVPWVALGPLLMIVVSRDRAPAVIAGLAVFFPSFVAATAGLTAATRDQADLLQALGTPAWRRFLLIRLPNATPSLVLGLKLAVPAAIIGAIFGEWFGADTGLGLLLLTSMQNFQPGLLWVVGFLAAGTTMACYGLLALLERWVARRFSLEAGEADTRRPAAGRRWVAVLGWLAFLVGLVACWHLYVVVSGVSPLLMPAPAKVWGAFADRPGLFFSSAFVTLRMAAAGLVLGLAVGVLAAVATWWSAFLRGFLTPVVLVARSVPTLALLPVVAGILGYNGNTILAIAVLLSFFPGFVFTSKGLRTPPQGVSDLGAALGVSRRRFFLLVALPSSLREIGVALRMSAGVCVIGAVVAEFLIGERGLGREFAEAMGRQNINQAWGIALVIVVVSAAAFAVANRLERIIGDRIT
jgi:sulfonate transport system permease protein